MHTVLKKVAYVCVFDSSVTLACCWWCLFSLKVRDASVVRRKRCAGGGALLLCVCVCVLHGKERKLAKGKGGGLALTEGPG